MSSRKSGWTPTISLAGYVFIYVMLALMSRSISFESSFSAVWLPSGFALAVFAYTPRRKWPLWLAGSIISSVIYNYLIQGKSPGVVFGFTLANVTRSLIGAFLIHWWLPGRLRLNQPRDIFVFTVAACLLAPLPTGVIGALTISLAYDGPYLSTFPTWYSGNVVGMMVVAPLTLILLAWGSGRSKSRYREQFSNRFSAFHFISAVTTTVFVAVFIFGFTTAPLSFLVAPCILWLVVQFELTGAASGIFAVAVVMLSCTTRGYGPMAEGYSVITRTILSQLFLTTVGATSLLLAAALQSSRHLAWRSERTRLRLATIQRETQLIFDTIPSMVFHKDGNNRILRVNPSAARWIGKPIHEIEGQLLSNVCLGSYDQCLSDDREVIRTGIAKLARESTLVLPSGEKRWISTDRMPLPKVAGKAPGVLVVVTDITDQKAIEEKLEQSNEDLERFAVIASHDLKEPLRAVTGYCQFLKEDYEDTLPKEANEYVDKAIEGAKRMTQMINDLLEYSRISRDDLEFGPVDLNDVVDQVLKDLKTRIDETGATVDIGELPHVLGAESQLHQLFQNLIANSLKFVSNDSPPLIQLIVEQGTDSIEVSVSDNGLGIDPKHQKRIFQIFQRLHRRSDYSGTGLGLAICDRIMQRHGGHIEVDSDLGQGARFRLIFPKPD